MNLEAGGAAKVTALIVGLLAFGVARDVPGEPVLEDQLQIVRVPYEHLAGAPQGRIDPCAFEAEGAVLFLTREEMSALGVPHERLGGVAEHTRRFRPGKTMATVGIPSCARLLGERVRASGLGRVAQGTVHLEYDRYHSPDEGIDFFHNLAAAYPDIARLDSIGTSVEGRDLWVLTITDHPDQAEADEQASFFCALHHAREWATHESILYLAEYMVTRYDTDYQVRSIVDNSVVLVLLAANPDGFAYSWDVSRFWRKNRRDNGDGTFGVDLNRNYDYNWGPNFPGSSGFTSSETYRGPSAASEPETQAIQTLLATVKPAIAVSNHTYSQLVLYPWGYVGTVNTESYTSLRAIADRYASIAKLPYGMTYIPGVANYTIYATNGDMTDYAYGAHGILAYTPEQRPASMQRGGFDLPEDQILPNARENFAAALWIMDNVAGARFIEAPTEGLFAEGSNGFSLPLTPVNQKPEQALGMGPTETAHLSARMGDLVHRPPYSGQYPADFEGTGSGSAYSLEVTIDSAEWAQNFTGYTALPHCFENGAVVQLENLEPGTNVIGIPCEHPVRMSDIHIYERIVTPVGNPYGSAETVLESRTALEDLQDPLPWISWEWTHTAVDGSLQISHPTGLNGADEYVYPFRAYSFEVNVPSYQFWSTNPLRPVYLLAFSGPLRGDGDGNGVIDADDYQALFDCWSGPVQSDLSPGCKVFDMDRDFDVDMADLRVFQQQFGRER